MAGRWPSSPTLRWRMLWKPQTDWSRCLVLSAVEDRGAETRFPKSDSKLSQRSCSGWLKIHSPHSGPPSGLSGSNVHMEDSQETWVPWYSRNCWFSDLTGLFWASYFCRDPYPLTNFHGNRRVGHFNECSKMTGTWICLCYRGGPSQKPRPLADLVKS